mmetsp:Transcript_8966/g.29706  ORF Transcript_8966/g.29706 Transcript_8966/m.29706 type:complete len:118 (+) Transcript_8966:596-949(+)
MSAGVGGVMMPAGLSAATLQKEGVLKLRGLPFTASKVDIAQFFEGYGHLDPNEDVKIVMNFDGRPSGEAYAIFKGEHANAQAAMAKDKQMIGSRYVELFASSMDELNRAVMGGKMVV